MDARKFDLNLLQAFDALMKEGNLTRAGFKVGMSQPSMSHALTRLRAIYGDPLFVRSAKGMEPTPYAKQIGGGISAGLALLQDSLDRPSKFDPMKCNSTFQILMSDLGELIYLPTLITTLERIAPNVNIRVMQLPRDAYHDALESGTADLAIGVLPGLKAGIYQQRLFEESSYVCLVRKGHPRIHDSLSLEQFCSESHILIEPAGSAYLSAAPQTSTTTLIESHLEALGLKRRIGLMVPHFVVVPEIVQKTNLLAIFAPSVMQHTRFMPDLKCLTLPFNTPSVEIKQFWHERNHQDAANRWLRGVIAELFMKNR